MTFTTEQLKTLSTWEDNFHKAVYADWSPNPGRSALQTIYDIFTSATGDKRRFSDNCNHCILSLLKDCGRAYFADKESLMNKENDTRAVKLSEEAAKPVKKASVKTGKKKTK